MKVWRYLQQLLQPSPAEPQVPPFILRQAENHVRIVNESAQIAAKSTVLETRVSRLGVANDHLLQLKALSANYPRIRITRIAQFELDIKKIEAEVRELEMLHPLQRDGLHDGWVYRVSLRFETPLKFLLQHGNEQNDKTQYPTDLPSEHGSWRPKLKSFRAMGIDIDEEPQSMMASPIGPIPLDGAEWEQLITHPGLHTDQICEYYFPTFLTTVPNLPRDTATAMWDVAMNTPEKIELATDEQLLAFKGIGPAVLRKLRARCREITEHPNEPRGDVVNR